MAVTLGRGGSRNSTAYHPDWWGLEMGDVLLVRNRSLPVQVTRVELATGKGRSLCCWERSYQETLAGTSTLV